MNFRMIQTDPVKRSRGVALRHSKARTGDKESRRPMRLVVPAAILVSRLGHGPVRSNASTADPSAIRVQASRVVAKNYAFTGELRPSGTFPARRLP
jgi:hypothetical protein